jgi:hypothetical protein
MSLLAATVCFIARHGGPADHFATFAEDLARKGHRVEIHASGPALKKCHDRKTLGVVSFSLEGKTEEEVAAQLAERCKEAAVVITDVGDPLDVTIQKALAEWAPEVLRLAYYDNPEAFVPGGYSEVAAKVMSAAQRVLFANANLAKTPIYEAPGQEARVPVEKRVGVGFYPLGQAEKIAVRRAAEHGGMRSQFFAKHGLKDSGQKVLVYAGGNNETYFAQALPAFLRLLEETDLSNYVIVLQQHPGAKEKNIDRKLVQEKAPQVLISDVSSDDAQVLADGMLYYQTSMGPQFVLAGLPVIQVGHERYEDVLVKNGLCAVATNPREWHKALADLMSKKAGSAEAVKQGLGLCSDWAERLAVAIE